MERHINLSGVNIPFFPLLQNMHVDDIISLCESSSQYRDVCNDSFVWTYLLKRDYNITMPGDPKIWYLILKKKMDMMQPNVTFSNRLGDKFVVNHIELIMRFPGVYILQLSDFESNRTQPMVVDDLFTSHLQTYLQHYALPYKLGKDISNHGDQITYDVDDKFRFLWMEQLPLWLYNAQIWEYKHINITEGTDIDYRKFLYAIFDLSDFPSRHYHTDKLKNSAVMLFNRLKPEYESHDVNIDALTSGISILRNIESALRTYFIFHPELIYNTQNGLEYDISVFTEILDVINLERRPLAVDNRLDRRVFYILAKRLVYQFAGRMDNYELIKAERESLNNFMILEYQRKIIEKRGNRLTRPIELSDLDIDTD